jgi:hypothetical protein
MLDIIDNAIDAGFHFHSYDDSSDDDINEDRKPKSSFFHGKIEAYEHSTKILANKRHEVIIINNSVEKIMPLDKILEVYKSIKGSGTHPERFRKGGRKGGNNHLSDNIGQNGVGKFYLYFFLYELQFIC